METKFSISTSAVQNNRPPDTWRDLSNEILEIVNNKNLTTSQILFGLHQYLRNGKWGMGEEGRVSIGFHPKLLLEILNHNEAEKAIEIIRGICDERAFYLDTIESLETYLAMLKSLGFKSMRISVGLWECIENGQVSEKKIESVLNRINLFEKYEIEPVVNLHHFDVIGNTGWKNGEFVEILIKVSKLLVDKLIEKKVRNFILINEPAVEAGERRMWGHWSPYKKNFFGYLNEMLRMRRFSIEIASYINAIALNKNLDVNVMNSYNISYFDPGPGSELNYPVSYITKYISEFIDQLQVRFLDSKDFNSMGVQLYWTHNSSWVSEVRKDITDALKNNLDRFFDRLVGDKGVLPNQLVEDLLDIFFKRFPDESFNKNLNTLVRGNHNQLLNPKLPEKVIPKLAKKFRKLRIAISEFGGDMGPTNGYNDPQRIKKFLNEFINSVKQVSDKEGIDVTFISLWTLIRNPEIIGFHGGGFGKFNFGLLGEPISNVQLLNSISEIFPDKKVSEEITKKIIQQGRVPVRIYESMFENLHEVFRNEDIESGLCELIENIYKINVASKETVNIYDLVCAYMQIEFVFKSLDQTKVPENVKEKYLEVQNELRNKINNWQKTEA